MAGKYLIGVDLGTSGTKAALYRPDGKLIAKAAMEVPIYYPNPGVVEQDNDDFYTSAAQTVHRCVQDSGIDPDQIAAIAFDSQMAGIGTIDEEYKPATRFDSWLDMRCQPYIEMMDREAGDLVTRLTGCPPTCDHGPKMLWWKHERPEEYRRVAKFITPAAYVAGTMAGLKADQAFMDYTFIHFSGCSDAQSQTWSAQLCDRLGLDQEKLPEIVEPWRIIGEVKDRAATDFGLSAGTSIAAGAGDTAANALGAGVVQPGMLFDVAGTAAVLAGCTDRFVADEKHRALLVDALGLARAVEPVGLYCGWRHRPALVPRSVLPGSGWAESGHGYRPVQSDDGRGRRHCPRRGRPVLLPSPGGTHLSCCAGHARRLDRLFVGAYSGALLPRPAGERSL